MTSHLPTSTDGLDVLQRLSQVRLAAIDIDGTLIDEPAGRVTDVIADLNGSLRHYRRSVTLTIATGRAFAGARPVIERLRLSRRTPVVLYNGAVVCRADGTRLSRLHAIDGNQVRHVVQLVLDAGMTALVYEPDFPLSLRGDPEYDTTPMVERVTGFAREPGPPLELNGLPVEWTTSLSETTPEGAAAIVIPTPHAAADLCDALMCVEEISVTSSSASFIEVRPVKANKGDALATIAAQLSIAASAVLAIGDGDNDVEMLRWAGCSVAVANSTPRALAECDYVTHGAAAQGVVETLRLLHDARRHRLT